MKYVQNLASVRNVQRIVFLTISSNQDMVVAIIAESTLDCIVSSYWFRLLTRGSLRPNMGVLRMARSAVMETREDSNQHVFRFCGFFSSLVSVMGLSCWGVCSYTSEPKMCHKIWTKCLWVCLERILKRCRQGRIRRIQSTCFRLLRVFSAC